MAITKQLLLNLSLLLVFLFFFQLWTDRYKEQKVARTPVMVYLSLSIIMCFLLSIEVNGEVRFDLRQIPFLIAGLYHGLPFSFIFGGLIIITRGAFGIDAGFWAVLLNFSIMSIFVGLAHKWFVKQNRNKRVLLAMLYSVVTSFGLITSLAVFNQSINTLELWISYVIIPAIGVGIIVYTMESYRQNMALRQQIMKYEKIEVISHLSAAISHEIENPINSIRYHLQLLKKDHTSIQDRSKLVSEALQELDRTEKILENYLVSTSKPSMEQIELIDINTELSHIIEICKQMYDNENISIHTKFLSNYQIYGEKHWIQQCFINMIKNSIEAMSDGGALRIETYNVEEEILIKVDDSGIGMSEEQISRLGEPYFTTKGNKGSGLGMMVVYSVVNAMKGNIHVDSEQGKGTCFYITFPAVYNH